MNNLDKIIDILKEEYLNINAQHRHDITLRWTITSALLLGQGYLYLELFKPNGICQTFDRAFLYFIAIFISLSIISINVYFEYKLAHNIYELMIMAGKINYYLGANVLFWSNEAEQLIHIVHKHNRKDPSLTAEIVMCMGAVLVTAMPIFLFFMNLIRVFIWSLIIAFHIAMILVIIGHLIYDYLESRIENFYGKEKYFIDFYLGKISKEDMDKILALKDILS